MITRYKLTPAVMEARSRYVRDWRRVHDLRRVSFIMLAIAIVLGLASLLTSAWWLACLAVLPFAGSLFTAGLPWPNIDEYLANVELVPEDVEDDGRGVEDPLLTSGGRTRFYPYGDADDDPTE